MVFAESSCCIMWLSRALPKLWIRTPTAQKHDLSQRFLSNTSLRLLVHRLARHTRRRRCIILRLDIRFRVVIRTLLQFSDWVVTFSETLIFHCFNSSDTDSYNPSWFAFETYRMIVFGNLWCCVYIACDVCLVWGLVARGIVENHDWEWKWEWLCFLLLCAWWSDDTSTL